MKAQIQKASRDFGRRGHVVAVSRKRINAEFPEQLEEGLPRLPEVKADRNSLCARDFKLLGKDAPLLRHGAGFMHAVQPDFADGGNRSGSLVQKPQKFIPCFGCPFMPEKGMYADGTADARLPAEERKRIPVAARRGIRDDCRDAMHRGIRNHGIQAPEELRVGKMGMCVDDGRHQSVL
jgi:hypothetical protein